MDFVFLQQLAVSLGLGLLLGLERERSEFSIAGIRTFPLISIFGTVCAHIERTAGGSWIVGTGLLSLAASLIFANISNWKSGRDDPGITTEVAALLLYVVGVLIVVGNSMAVAVVIGGVMAVLLHAKQPMHKFAGAVGKRDMRAIMHFVLLSLVILPVLPNGNHGPYGVWNPFKIWLMVVLIVGIGLGGYVAFKIFGARAGTLLGGLIGGLISSTATTVSFARRTALQDTLAPVACLVIMIATCVSFVRVIGEIAVVAPGSFAAITPPLFVLLAVCAAISTGIYVGTRKQAVEMSGQSNPAELKAAFVFGALYAVVLLAVAIAQNHFGDAGLYVVGIISGLTDMDAITLSTAGRVDAGRLDPNTAWRTILLAAMANFVFKFGIVSALGSARLVRRIALVFSLVLAGCGLILWLWPVAV